MSKTCRYYQVKITVHTDLVLPSVGAKKISVASY